MANFERFTEQEIPYGILEKFGLTHEMIDDLPQSVTLRMLSGRYTPVLPVVTENVAGEMVKTMARVSLARLNDGTVDVCFAPQWVDEDLTAFSEDQQEKLRLGDVVVASMDGKGQCFVQFDDTINQVMAVPVNIIRQNLSILEKEMQVDGDEVDRLAQGGIVELQVNGETVTAGIDLNEMGGIRLTDGDVQAWREDAKADQLPRYSFGIFGCWVADDNNELTYVSEEDYTDEILEQQKRAGQMNAAGASLKQLKI